MKINKCLLAFFVFLFSATVINAQEIEKSSKTQVIGNIKYYLHTVKQGHSIYLIAKAYSVEVQKIYGSNPEIKQQIVPGIVLKVPFIEKPENIKYIIHTVDKGETLFKIASLYNIKVADLTQTNEGLTENLKIGQQVKIPLGHVKTAAVSTSMHIVQKGETLFSIAAKYSTTVNELKNLNKGITENLQPGQMLKVPLTAIKDEKITTKDSVIVFDCGKPGLLPEYKIALLIPFYLEHASGIDTSADENPVSSYRSLRFIQFLEGVLLAIDSLEKTGFKAKVYVYDVSEDAENANQVIKHQELKNMNLIIGPFFGNNFQIVSKWANENKIPIVNPFSTKTEVIESNPLSVKLIPSSQSVAIQLKTFLINNYSNSNIIVVYNDKEADVADSVFSVLKSDINKKSGNLKITKTHYPTDGFSGISNNLSDTNINIIITLIEGEAFVSNFLRILNERSFSHKLIVFGKKSWEDYSNIETQYILNLNTHIISGSFVDYHDSKTQDMILNFRNRFNTDPDYYGFSGYDIFMYFTGALKSYGPGFMQCLGEYKPSLLTGNFSFVKYKEGGFENTTSIIYRFKDYKAINALKNPLRKEEVIVNKKP